MRGRNAPAKAGQASAGGPASVLSHLLSKYMVQLILILLLVLFSALSEPFRTASTYQSILLRAAGPGCVAVGLTVLIVCGAIDLSVAGILSFGVAKEYNFQTFDQDHRVLLAGFRFIF